MIKLIVGFIWTTIVSVVFTVCLVVPAEQRNGVEMNPFLFIFFIAFEIIGFYLLISGLRKVIKDRKTKKYGINCYGIITDIQTNGTYVNDKPQYKAILNIINPETNQIETVEEDIGFDYNKYPINSYVLCKYYQGDINFENPVTESELPGDIRKYLVPTQQMPTYNSLEVSADGEYIIVDGVKYKKNQ